MYIIQKHVGNRVRVVQLLQQLASVIGQTDVVGFRECAVIYSVINGISIDAHQPFVPKSDGCIDCFCILHKLKFAVL